MAESPGRPVAIVTGAGSGIGRGCAIALAAAGFDLVLNDLHGGTLPEVAALVAQNGGSSVEVAADIGDLSTHPSLLDAAIASLGRVDCLINNAGVSVMERGDLLDVKVESFDRCLTVNTRALFFLTQRVARAMLDQGEIGGRHRSIVNITSSNATMVSIHRGEYCVSKAGASMTTRLFAVRLAAAGIGVYEIRPGIIETGMTRLVRDKYDEFFASGRVPMPRWGRPDDVASTAVCMAEGRLIYTVGQAVAVDGGLAIPHY